MRKIMTMMAAMLLTVGICNAQVFVLDEENGNTRAGTTPEDISLIVPIHGVNYDQYVPLGGGTALLIGFGAAYMLAGKRKE